MNNPAIIIQARMGSTRLPGKVMLDLEGVPVLMHVVRRMQIADLGEVIVATSDQRQDDVIFDLCKGNGVKCFRGSETDVLERFYKCSKEGGYDVIIRITADCPLVDSSLIQALYKAFQKNKFAYARIDTETFPRGFDAEVFSFELLEQACQNARTQAEREHVTLYMRSRRNKVNAGALVCNRDFSEMRLTLDTKDDYRLVRIVMQNVKSLTFENIVYYLKENHGLLTVNCEVKQKTTSLQEVAYTPVVYRI